jgi:hypothetical protein
VAVLTAVACISIYGHLASDFLASSGATNPLSPTNNGVSAFIYSTFQNDRFINLAALSNIGVLLALASRAWSGLHSEPRLRPAIARPAI